MGTPLSGGRSSSTTKGKVKNWGNEYERLGVALMKYVNHSGAKDDGTFIVKDEIIALESAIRGHAALIVSAEARAAFGLPALVINEKITETWGYPGITPGDPVTMEYEKLRAARVDEEPRTIFLSKEFLEKNGRHHAGAGTYTPFLPKKTTTAAASEYTPATLIVTEPLSSALFVHTGATKIRPSTGGRLRGKFKQHYATTFANEKIEALLMAQVDAGLQRELARTTEWTMVNGFARDCRELYAMRRLQDGTEVRKYDGLVHWDLFTVEKLKEKALLRQFKMHGELNALDHYCGGHDLSKEGLRLNSPPDWGEWEPFSAIVRAVQGGLLAGSMPSKDDGGTRETIFPSFAKTKKLDGYLFGMQTRLLSTDNNELDFAGLHDLASERTAIKVRKVRGKAQSGNACVMPAPTAREQAMEPPTTRRRIPGCNSFQLQ